MLRRDAANERLQKINPAALWGEASEILNVACRPLAESNDVGCNVRFSRVEGIRISRNAGGSVSRWLTSSITADVRFHAVECGRSEATAIRTSAHPRWPSSFLISVENP